jgi:hypothetical protein
VEILDFPKCGDNMLRLKLLTQIFNDECASLKVVKPNYTINVVPPLQILCEVENRITENVELEKIVKIKKKKKSK